MSERADRDADDVVEKTSPWREFERDIGPGEEPIQGRIRAVRRGEDVVYDVEFGDLAVRVPNLMENEDYETKAVGWGEERQVTDDYWARGVVLPHSVAQSVTDLRDSYHSQIAAEERTEDSP